MSRRTTLPVFGDVIVEASDIFFIGIAIGLGGFNLYTYTESHGILVGLLAGGIFFFLLTGITIHRMRRQAYWEDRREHMDELFDELRRRAEEEDTRH